jgi:hypothetical protein
VAASRAGARAGAHVQLGGPDRDKLRMIHILKASMYKASAPVHLQHCRGTFQAGSGLMGGGEHPPDTFLSTPGFSKVWPDTTVSH